MYQLERAIYERQSMSTKFPDPSLRLSFSRLTDADRRSISRLMREFTELESWDDLTEPESEDEEQL
jgi:hypothetical protein